MYFGKQTQKETLLEIQETFTLFPEVLSVLNYFVNTRKGKGFHFNFSSCREEIDVCSADKEERDFLALARKEINNEKKISAVSECP